VRTIRTRRIALLTVAAGCLVVAGLVVVAWGPVREHLDAERFLTRVKHIETLRPGSLVFLDGPILQDGYSQSVLVFRELANYSGCPVLFDLEWARYPVPSGCWGMLSTDLVLGLLRSHGFRVVKQRFRLPNAYVVTGYPVSPDWRGGRVRP
jgi:hypothetical protein